MRLFLFTTNRCDYEQYDSFAIVATSEKAAWRVLNEKLNESAKVNRQYARDFTCRAVNLKTEPEGIICDSFNAG